MQTLSLPDELRCGVVNQLVQLGWSAADGPACATRIFQTAAGDKQAIAWLSRGGEGDPNRTLYGEFWSEGRNILAAHSMPLPKQANAEQLRELVGEFCERADAAVRESYAAPLLRRRAP